MWRGEDQGRYLEYDCTYCIKKGWYKNRVCFLKNRKLKLKVPEYDLGTGEREAPRVVSCEIKEMTKEDVVKKLVECHGLFPNKLVHDVLFFPHMRMGLNNEYICPVGLFDYEANTYVALETAASKYHNLPFSGSYLDQPLDIIEAFDTIRAAEARYTNHTMNELKQKSSAQSGRDAQSRIKR